MSNKRPRVARYTEDEIHDLVSKLQSFLSDQSGMRSNKTASGSKILRETCKYIKKLQKEVDNLSDGLSQLMASGNITTSDADIITTLLKL